MILSLQLPFAVFPLVLFTSDRREDGPVRGAVWMQALAWPVAVIIAALNVWLLYQTFSRGIDACTDASSSPSSTRAADQTILAHVDRLARLTGAELLLVHVADGWAARHFDELKLRESEEMTAATAPISKRCAPSSQRRRLHAAVELAMGDPATELSAPPSEHGVDLIAMTTHGHRFLSDVLHGTTADRVRHLVKVPVLLLRAQ